MSNGWINLHRCIQEHWIWQDAHRFKWWVDLLLRASHKDTKVLIDGAFKDCRRGQFITSLSKLAEEWNVSRDIVRHFLNMLESDEMISRHTTQKYTQITICNYDSYQSEATTEPQLSHNSPTAKATTEPQLSSQQSAQITSESSGGYKDTPTTEPQLSSQENPQLSHTINNSITTSSNTSNSNKRGGKKTQTVFVPPTLEEVVAYCKERGRGVNPNKWFNHYVTVGWMVGRNKMKDWRAAVRKWEDSEYDKPKQSAQKNTDKSQYRNPAAVYSSESDI